MKKVLAVIIVMLGCVAMSSCRSRGGESWTQLEAPQAGDPIAIIKTSMGDITLRLFPQYAPMAVENFTTHAKNGFYDGIIFHRVLNNFMIQTGDPLGTGTGGESIWGHGFDNETMVGLHHIRGALSMANRGPGTNGSQFFIVQNPNLDFGTRNMFIQAINDPDHRLRENIPLEFLQNYIDNGGTPHLDTPGLNTPSVHTVFGQVIDGMDVVDAIAAVPVNDPQVGRPLEEVYIITIEIGEYQ